VKPAPLPKDEVARLRALCRLHVLDTRPEERFDRITRICKAHFQFPIVLVSLVDRERQWFKSSQGLDAAETSRDISFCGHAIVGQGILCVPDTAADPRFADNPLVKDAPYIGSYFGAPLVTSDGFALGTLCLIDTRPRTLSTAERAILTDFSGLVVAELERDALEAATARYCSQTTRLETVLATVADGIITLDESGRIEDMNPAVSELFGYSASELHGRHVDMLVPTPYAQEHAGYPGGYPGIGNVEAIDSGRKLLGKRKDGSEFPVELTVSEMALEGKRYFVAVLRDISGQTKAERMKRAFIATVSHELRTPLTSIRGALNLVVSKAAGGLPEKSRRMLEMAQRNSERLTLLINDILDLEKIETGGLEMELAGLDLSKLAARALEDNEGYAAKHGVVLSPLAASIQAPVWGDEHRLLQVFANLISNAVKFSPRGGVVTTTLIEHDRGFRVGVRDHGPGIPESFRTRIFKRFAQADGSSTRQRGGSGLGLNIAKAIVEQHGGSIGYESEDGVGTLFYFDLPRWHEVIESAGDDEIAPRALVCEDNPDAAEILCDSMLMVDWLQKTMDEERLAHAVQTVDGSGRPARILHVEDDPDIVEIVHALCGKGIELRHAATLSAARQALATNRFDLILLDLGLADGIGIDLLDELKGDCPVVIFSCQTPCREVNDRVAAALTKSVTTNDQLIVAIKRALRRREPNDG